jgi:RNA polymerase sigma-70 factor (ECF subfamily)
VAASESERFDDLWANYAGPIYAYAARRVGRNDADEIVADVFAVVWRRIDDIPERALPWLYGVARNVIREHRRAAERHARLHEAVAKPSPTTAGSDDLDVVIEAMALLDETDQEVLRLVAWEELTPREAAEVIGVSGPAFRMRLTRARRRLRAATDEMRVVELEN